MRGRRLAHYRWSPGLAAAAALAVSVAGAAAAQIPPELEPVAERVRANDPATALRLLEALPSSVRRQAVSRYLLGRLYELDGDHGRALAAWDGLGDGLPDEVARNLEWRRAAALARAGRCERARVALADHARGRGRRAALARALRAECAARLGIDGAIDELRRVARDDAVGVDTFAVRLTLAEQLARSDREAAVDELRALLVDRPEHPDAERVEAQLRAWGADLDFDRDARMRRAERLLDQRRPREAIVEIDAAGRPAARADAVAWLHLRGMALFATRRDYAEAARVLGEAARLGGPTEGEDAFHAARALSRADRDDEAIAAYRRFARSHRAHARAAEAEYLAAWLEVHHGRAAGERNLRRFLSGSHGRGAPTLARNARFLLGFSAYGRGRYAVAERELEQYARSGTGAMVRGRGRYWVGRCRQLRGDRAGAVEAYRQAIAIEPLHWYGLWARKRLVELGEDPGPPLALADDEEELPALSVSVPASARFYAALGLRADAVAAVSGQEAAIREEAPRGQAVRSVVQAYRQVGDPTRPYRLVAVAEADDALMRRPGPATLWAWEAAYPRPFAEHVEREARSIGLRPEQLWGIMRQESGFDPEVVSYADAIGLLQLLPATAERVGAPLGVTVRRSMLFEPAWNVRIASRYVATLMAQMDGNVPLAFASFNGGAHNVQRWKDERGELPLDEFVERIPFEQTRNYVRRVTSHYAHYLYLADEARGWPEIPGL